MPTGNLAYSGVMLTKGERKGTRGGCGEGGGYGTDMGVMDTLHLLSPHRPNLRTPFTPDGDEAQPTIRTGEMRAP